MSYPKHPVFETEREKYLSHECLALKMKLNKAMAAMEEAEKMIDKIKYECEASVYTLEDDEMGTVFYVRDYLTEKRELINKMLKEIER